MNCWVLLASDNPNGVHLAEWAFWTEWQQYLASVECARTRTQLLWCHLANLSCPRLNIPPISRRVSDQDGSLVWYPRLRMNQRLLKKIHSYLYKYTYTYKCSTCIYAFFPNLDLRFLSWLLVHVLHGIDVVVWYLHFLSFSQRTWSIAAMLYLFQWLRIARCTWPTGEIKTTNL